MKYKDIEVTYKGKQFKVSLYRCGNESDQEMEQKALEVVERLYNDTMVRSSVFK